MIGIKSGGATARRLLKLGLGIVMLALFMAAPGWVEAQGSGSSFGGGDWGGGGGYDYGSGGGGSDYGGGGGDYDYGGGGSGYSGSSSYSSGGSASDMEALFCFLLFAALFMTWIFYPLLKEDKKRRKTFTPSGGARTWNRVDVTTLQIAVDWRARMALQKKLEQLARSGRTRSKRGLTKLLRETGIRLLRVERSWLYAYVRNYHPSAPPQAQGTFTRRANAARTKYEHELVRSDGGDLMVQDWPDFEKRAVEGEGVVVVTLVVAAKQELLDVHPKDFSDAAQIRHFLQHLTSLPEVIALEVIWSPSAEDDRMSTAELEMVYPELVKLDEASIAGRVFCKYCSAPFAAELMKCPHCGAPVDKTSASENSAQDA